MSRVVSGGQGLDTRDRELLARWNDTAVPLPHATVPGIFDEIAASQPAAVAVQDGSASLSYAELRSAANRFAHVLASHGVRPGDHVGLLMRRSADLVVAMLGSAKAGAAFVPLDKRYPPHRMRTILRNVDARLLVTDETTRDHQAAAEWRIVKVPVLEQPDADMADATWASPADPDAVFYVMHTSGSAGEPKGVQVTHRNVIALALDRVWRSGAHDRVLFHSPPAFDASTYELWVPLLSGGRVVVSAEDLDSVLLRRLCGSGLITALWLTAGLFAALAEADPGCLAGIQEVWTGGDVVSRRAVDRVVAACPELAIYNGYGPTETTTFATRFRVNPGPRTSDDVPIGTPMDNTRIYLLDDDLCLLPPGESGQLFVGGAGVALGYVNRPDLTRERFLPDPFGPPGDRMYATGDLARWERDGYLRFLGRADNQVKINGFRIEPGEIESMLRGHPQIAHAAVAVWKGNDGEGRLLAAVVPGDASASPDCAELLGYLRERLPDYMVPTEIALREELPLTANGKVDRTALLDEDRQKRELPPGDLKTDTERVLAELLSSLLDVPVTSADVSFWDLGGTSLQAVRLVGQIRAQLQAELRLQDLFTDRTIGELAAFIDTHRDK